MSHSLNETEALCRKAARGAGFSWGLAEDAGFAARWLQAQGLPGAALLAGCLEAVDGQDYAQLAPDPAHESWRARGGTLCPIIAGACLSDHGGAMVQGHAIRLGPVRYPILLAPFAAMISARAYGPVRLDWPGASVRVAYGGCHCDGDVSAPMAAQVTCACGQNQIEPTQAPHSRADIAPDILARLTALAQRTYAPATEASRIAGAGAGLQDND